MKLIYTHLFILILNTQQLFGQVTEKKPHYFNNASPYYNENLKVSRSVVKIHPDLHTGSGTGVLINNHMSDGAPYILTAAHNLNKMRKQGPPETWRVVFNDICRNGNKDVHSCLWPLPGVTSKSTNGVEILWKSNSADIALLKLKEKITWKQYYAGFKYTSQPSNAIFTIHHMYGKPQQFARHNGYIKMSHDQWKLTWQYGNIDSGSSGAPVFDEMNNEVIGLINAVDKYTRQTTLISSLTALANHELMNYLFPGVVGNPKDILSQGVNGIIIDPEKLCACNELNSIGSSKQLYSGKLKFAYAQALGLKQNFGIIGKVNNGGQIDFQIYNYDKYKQNGKGDNLLYEARLTSTSTKYVAESIGITEYSWWDFYYKFPQVHKSTDIRKNLMNYKNYVQKLTLGSYAYLDGIKSQSEEVVLVLAVENANVKSLNIPGIGKVGPAFIFDHKRFDSCMNSISNGRLTNEKFEILQNENDKEKALIYPNPFDNYFEVVLSLESDQQVNFSILNPNGTLLKVQTLSIKKGQHLIRIDNEIEWSSGTYLLKIQYDNKMQIKRIMKR